MLNVFFSAKLTLNGSSVAQISTAKLFCKDPDKDKEEKQEAAPGIAAAKETSVEDAVAAVLSKLGGIFTLKEEQRLVSKTFFSLCSLAKSLDKHHSALQLATGCRRESEFGPTHGLFTRWIREKKMYEGVHLVYQVSQKLTLF